MKSKEKKDYLVTSDIYRERESRKVTGAEDGEQGIGEEQERIKELKKNLDLIYKQEQQRLSTTNVM